MPILVVNFITFVTIAFFAGSYEWAARRLARKVAPQHVSLRDRIRLASVYILPFLAWSLYCSFQPWDSYALAFTFVVVIPALMLYVIVRRIIRIVQRRRRRSTARAEALMRSGGEV